MLYDAACAGRDDPLPPLPLQYADYADWQRAAARRRALGAAGAATGGSASAARGPAWTCRPTGRARRCRPTAAPTLRTDFDPELTDQVAPLRAARRASPRS